MTADPLRDCLADYDAGHADGYRAGYREGEAAALRATLDAQGREVEGLRAALERLASPDEMNGMGNVDDMPPGPARGELEARMRYARAALDTKEPSDDR